ncbi:MAG: ferrous iron transport protein B [Pseudomonadota bacterium]|nr:ferrous iron transport protein B [Pseudomonadota bacterium]
MILTPTRIILVGLPNTGKTTIFNQITGACFKVGNWSGVTVDAHKVCLSHQGREYEIIDLPGILSTYDTSDQMDYQVCRDQIMSADVIINVVDGRFLQRDLVLTLQLLGFGKPQFSLVTHMEELPVQANSVFEAIPCPACSAESVMLRDIINMIPKNCQQVDIESIMEWPVGFSAIWKEVKKPFSEKLEYLVSKQAEVKASQLGIEEPLDVLIAEGFYQTAAILVDRSGARQVETSFHDWLDKYLLHPYFGVPIFLLVLYWVFVLTIGLGGALGDLVAGHLILAINLMPRDMLIWVIIHSVGTGFATAIGFVPILGVMYVLLSLLEQSGYLSRVVLLTDGLMRPIGLSGHGFIPMILGFGCNVPAVFATRAISGEQQRVLTAMILPFMSCSARLSIFAVFAAAFFPSYGALVILCLYCLGVVVGILSIALMRYALAWEADTTLSIHLSEYQFPDKKLIFKGVQIKLMGFLKRTMGYIVLFAALFSVLNHINFFFMPVDDQASIISWVGRNSANYFGFMGLGPDNWQAVVALLSGAVAKEIVLTTLNSLYQTNVVLEAVTLADSLQLFAEFGERITQMFLQILIMDGPTSVETTVYQQYFSVRSALAYMVFILLYFPCVSTLVALKQECGFTLAITSFIWTTGIAAWAAKIVYLGVSSYDCLLGVVIFLTARYYRKSRLKLGSAI